MRSVPVRPVMRKMGHISIMLRSLHTTHIIIRTQVCCVPFKVSLFTVTEHADAWIKPSLITSGMSVSRTVIQFVYDISNISRVNTASVVENIAGQNNGSLLRNINTLINFCSYYIRIWYPKTMISLSIAFKYLEHAKLWMGNHPH